MGEVLPMWGSRTTEVDRTDNSSFGAYTRILARVGRGSPSTLTAEMVKDVEQVLHECDGHPVVDGDAASSGERPAKRARVEIGAPTR